MGINPQVYNTDPNNPYQDNVSDYIDPNSFALADDDSHLLAHIVGAVYQHDARYYSEDSTFREQQANRLFNKETSISEIEQFWIEKLCDSELESLGYPPDNPLKALRISKPPSWQTTIRSTFFLHRIVSDCIKGKDDLQTQKMRCRITTVTAFSLIVLTTFFLRHVFISDY